MYMDIWYVIEVATEISGRRVDYFNGVGESEFTVWNK